MVTVMLLALVGTAAAAGSVWLLRRGALSQRRATCPLTVRPKRTQTPQRVVFPKAYFPAVPRLRWLGDLSNRLKRLLRAKHH